MVSGGPLEHLKTFTNATRLTRASAATKGHCYELVDKTRRALVEAASEECCGGVAPVDKAQTKLLYAGLCDSTNTGIPPSWACKGVRRRLCRT